MFTLVLLLFLAALTTTSSIIVARPITLITGQETTDGDNVTVRRFIGNDQTPPLGARSADPFLVFDFYNTSSKSRSSSSSTREETKKTKNSRNTGDEFEFDDDDLDEDEESNKSTRKVAPGTFHFPAHPHAGFVEIRYLLDGSMDHLDSCGVKGTVRGGQLHVLRAMRGIAHEEVLRESDDTGRLRGFQLWLDVPLEQKKTEKPSYRVVDKIPVQLRADGDWSLVTRSIAGGDSSSPVSALKDMSLEHFVMVDVTARRRSKDNTVPTATPTAIFNHTVEDASEEQQTISTCVVFSIAGHFSVSVTDEKHLRHVAPGQLFVTVLRAGEQLSVVADANGTRRREVGDELRFLMACAPPLRQKVFKWQGLVFSDRESLDKTVAQLKSGTFAADC